MSFLNLLHQVRSEIFCLPLFRYLNIQLLLAGHRACLYSDTNLNIITPFYCSIFYIIPLYNTKYNICNFISKNKRKLHLKMMEKKFLFFLILFGRIFGYISLKSTVFFTMVTFVVVPLVVFPLLVSTPLS